MFTDFPKSAKEFLGWGWDDFFPYYEYLLNTEITQENINEWLKRIDSKQAMPDMPTPNGINTPFYYPATEGLPVRDPDTSYLCVVDKWGNAFSATPSDGMWRSPVVPGLGIIPSPRGTQSRPDPTHPSGVGPGRRPRLTPNPAIALRDDGTVVPFGARIAATRTRSVSTRFSGTCNAIAICSALNAKRSSISPHAMHGNQFLSKNHFIFEYALKVQRIKPLYSY